MVRSGDESFGDVEEVCNMVMLDVVFCGGIKDFEEFGMTLAAGGQ